MKTRGLRKFIDASLTTLVNCDWPGRVAHTIGLQKGVTTAKYEIFAPKFGHAIRIAFASDFHVGALTDGEVLRGAYRMLREAEPDVLLLGGDFISSRRANLTELASQLSRVPARLGRYAVLGDHDKRGGTENVKVALEAQGIRVLANEEICLTAPAEDIRIFGLNDLKLADELPFRDHHGVTVVFTHSPANLELLTGGAFTVAFCGHTHGGQIALPGRRPIYVPGGRICRRLSAGRYDTNGAADRIVIVSRGVGCSLIPVRLFAPADVVICDLVPCLNSPGATSGNRKDLGTE